MNRCKLGFCLFPKFFLEEISFIDKTDPSDSTRREEFWIDTLKTRYPLEFNIMDAYH